MLALSIVALVTASHLDVKQLDKGAQRLAAKAGQGRLGIAVHDFNSDERWSLRGDESFPLQSVFKVMAGARLLQDVDAGKRRLDEVVPITATDLGAFWSPIADAWTPNKPVTYTLQQLIEYAVAKSDNTAGDMIMRMVGGPAALNAMFARVDILGIRVDRYERELQPDCVGLPPFAPNAVIDRAKFERDIEALPEATRRSAFAANMADVRDTSTPNAAVAFLDALAKNKLLSARNTKLLVDIMMSTTTGKGRLKALLPKGATIAHKTGTAGDVYGVSPAVNDIGIVTLPNGRQVAIAVFLSGAKGSDAARESIIAEVGKLVIESLR